MTMYEEVQEQEFDVDIELAAMIQRDEVYISWLSQRNLWSAIKDCPDVDDESDDWFDGEVSSVLECVVDQIQPVIENAKSMGWNSCEGIKVIEITLALSYRIKVVYTWSFLFHGLRGEQVTEHPVNW